MRRDRTVKKTMKPSKNVSLLVVWLAFQTITQCRAVEASSTGCAKLSSAEQNYIPKSNLHATNKDVPDAFDWRDVDGVNYATPSRSQLVPKACGSCWAFAATGALSDRISILQGGQLPDVNLSPQHLLNADADTDAPGTCNGGSAHLAYDWVRNTGYANTPCFPFATLARSLTRRRSHRRCQCWFPPLWPLILRSPQTGAYRTRAVSLTKVLIIAHGVR